MRLLGYYLFFVVLLAGCNRNTPAPAAGAPVGKLQTLLQAREGFKSKLRKSQFERTPVDNPPAQVFRTVQYNTSGGALAAYLTPNPGDGQKHPAIIWITGGDCNSIDDGLWKDAPADNDQTAAAYRKAGIIMMSPSLRGGNHNPGFREGFLGEVDDILSAANFLSKQDYVDPNRIYLGGHSTGGTLVLLVAECTDRFRAVFSFGPVDDVNGYGPEYLPFDISNPKETDVRSPGQWIHCIKSPVFVLEGAFQGNIESLDAMARTSRNPQVHFLRVKNATHFSVLAPVNRLIADKIRRDTGAATNLTLTSDEVNKLFER